MLFRNGELPARALIAQTLKLASQAHVDHPEIFVVSNIVREGKHIGSFDAGSLWHTDGAYLAKPHAISALRALEVPAQNGCKPEFTYLHNWQPHDLVMWDDCSTQHMPRSTIPRRCHD